MKYENETHFQNAVFDQNMSPLRAHVYNMRLFFRKFFFIHGKELESCRDGQLFNHTVFAGKA